ncbi:TPA: glutamate racemase [Candidatus Dependentiae bacterium]|nr:MAG: Glutamate racemase [candidate division TM6 bacterium GW2011_GWE2_31_21]KKP52937.1 MAG: Glutamate racemase [candidate division TM6 bacterium GW2011_GWF2_33_332]HBS47822.1 glutamate racemase [Candidatus Dependentiae bacterium]HBZ73202.1 glutamate racemase [Candidatus Dependentiae bacterium]
MKKSQPIGIFDSGVGGLGIFQKIAEPLPNEDLIYIGDNKNCPYGEKTVEELQQITTKLLNFLVTNHDIKIAVIACNTASTTCLDYLRERFTIPIIGVVPTVKPACEITKTKQVAILGTSRTVNSAYQKKLIEQFATGKGINVLGIACPDLVSLVESGQLEGPEVEEKLREYLALAIRNQADVVGLSCTHFPFLKQQIKKLLPKEVIILDSNEAVAKQVVRILSTLPPEMIAATDHKPNYTVYATKNLDIFKKTAKKLIGSGDSSKLCDCIDWTSLEI